MVLWIIFAGLSLVTLAFVCRPLLAGGAPSLGGSDEVIYAAQLEEIEADRARGTLRSQAHPDLFLLRSYTYLTKMLPSLSE